MNEPKLRIAGIETPATPARNVTARRPVPASYVVASGVLTLGVIGALYFAVESNNGSRRSVAQEQELQSQLPASAPANAGKPVRYANPFDPKEVFEFPAGTSEAQARDAVAQVLLDRAMKRQRKFDARVSNNHN